MSARVRIPLTGRSNLSQDEAHTGRSFNTDARRNLNDPVYVLRPYSAEGVILDAHKTRPPILPKSRFSTVPSVDPTLGIAKRGRGLHANPICPDGWVERNLKPNWFETIDQSSALFDYEAKVLLCREFVERNQHQMWKYNLEYLNRTPRGVAENLCDNPGFIKLMSTMHDKERRIRLSNSDRVKVW